MTEDRRAPDRLIVREIPGANFVLTGDDEHTLEPMHFSWAEQSPEQREINRHALIQNIAHQIDYKLRAMER